MKKALILFSVLALVVSASISCQKEKQPATPQETIQAVMNAYIAKDFAKVVSFWDLSETDRLMMQSLYESLDKSGSLPVVTRVELLSTTITEVDGVETAVVKYRMHYEGKPSADYDGKLVKKDGKWLVSSATLK